MKDALWDLSKGDCNGLVGSLNVARRLQPKMSGQAQCEDHARDLRKDPRMSIIRPLCFVAESVTANHATESQHAASIGES